MNKKMNVGSASHTGALDAAWLSHKSLYGRPRSVLIRAGVLRTAIFFILDIIQKKVSLRVDRFCHPWQDHHKSNVLEAVFFGNVTWRGKVFFMYGRVGAWKLVVKNN